MAQTSRKQSFGTETAIYGVITGILVYVTGFLLTYMAAASAISQTVQGYTPLSNAGAAAAPTWKAVGWVFYDAHFVGTQLPTLSGSVDLVGISELQYLYLLPPVLLVAAGGIVATLMETDRVLAGVKTGMAIAIGYLLFAIVGAILVSFAGIQPSLLFAVIVAGIVYPLLFGAIGGGLVGALRVGGSEPVTPKDASVK